MEDADSGTRAQEERHMPTRFYLAAALTLLTSLPVLAEDQHCVAQCTQQEEDCASGALQAIYDGVFYGSGCSDYEECNTVVQDCRAEAQTCQASCG